MITNHRVGGSNPSQPTSPRNGSSFIVLNYFYLSLQFKLQDLIRVTGSSGPTAKKPRVVKLEKTINDCQRKDVTLW